MKESFLKLVNGKILTPSGLLTNGHILISNGKIVEISDKNVDVPSARTVDVGGNYIAPGCIDIHVHGANGHDFTEATPEAFYEIARAHALHGTTALYPTLAVAPVEVFRKAIKVCEKVMDRPEKGARIMGLHLEGNYLNMSMKGGQDPDYIALPNPEEYISLLNSTNCIKRWTAAAELEGALEFARYASSKGVLVSLGHTVADYKLVKKAYQAGFTHATHFYNAMTSVHKHGEYKHEGTVEGIYLMKDMTVELVADGIHVPPAILRMVYEFKGIERISLVTDAMSAAACCGTAQMLDPRFVIEEGVCKLADRSALAGSIATGDRLILTLVNEAEIPLADAVRMASESPARLMGILDRKGTLEKGKDADLILLDKDLRIQGTIVEGEQIK